MSTTAFAPTVPQLDPARLDQTLTILAQCRQLSGHCADRWLANSPLSPDALRCIRLLLDCADLCAAVEDLLPHFEEANPAVLRSHLNTCALACERTARESLRHPLSRSNPCIEACRLAAQACRDTIPLLPTVAAAAA